MASITVYDANALRDAVSSNNGIDYVYLGGDISIPYAGITIYPGKETLVIDGEHPQGSGIIHTLTDYNSISYLDTLGIRATSDIAITMKNMTINGRNYYGVPYIAENSILADTSGVSVTYENVSYTGPQLTYNRNGLTRYVNCDITIRQTGASEAQEVGEVDRVEIGGRTTILHESTYYLYSVFWFRDEESTSSLTVLPDADVEITSVNNYFMFNRDGPLDIPTYLVPVNYTIRSGARLSMTMNKSLTYDQTHILNSFTVERDASFRYVQTAGNGTADSLPITGVLSVGDGASFYMEASNGTQPLISYSGTSGELVLDNPLSFVLYSPNSAALYSANTAQFSFHSGQLNTWNEATVPVESAGDYLDLPPNKWNKKDFLQLLEITGSFGPSSTTVLSHNLLPEDEYYSPLTDLRLDTAEVVSAGDWLVMINPVTDTGTEVAGWTQPYTDLRVSYIDGGHHLLSGLADADGVFLIDTSEASPGGITAATEITVLANIRFLIKHVITVVIEEGELEIESAPGSIEFLTSPVSVNPVLLPRGVFEIPLIVKDMRSPGSRWNLLASIDGPLQSEQGDVMEDAVVYLQNPGAQPVPLGTIPVAVYEGGPNVETTEVEWAEDAGILVHVTRPMRCGVTYSANITWSLQILEQY